MTYSLFNRGDIELPAVTARPRRTVWWRLSFTADPWRRMLYVALAVPVAVIAVVDGGRLQ
jgi:hypothetical protein